MDIAALIEWMSQNRETLTWISGGIVTAASGIWAATKFLLSRGAKASNGRAASTGDGAAPAGEAPNDGGVSVQQTPPPPAAIGRAASTGSGVAAAGNVSIGGDVTVQQTHLPRAAIGLAVIGLAILAYAAFFSGGDCIQGAVTAGDVTDSQITVTATVSGDC